MYRSQPMRYGAPTHSVYFHEMIIYSEKSVTNKSLPFGAVSPFSSCA